VAIEHVSIDLIIANPLRKGLPSKEFIGHVENMDIMCTTEG